MKWYRRDSSVPESIDKWLLEFDSAEDLLERFTFLLHYTMSREPHYYVISDEAYFLLVDKYAPVLKTLNL